MDLHQDIHQHKKQKKGVFIIYSHQDEQLAETLYHILSQIGLRPFYCQQVRKEPKSAQNYRADLLGKLKASTVAITLLSKNFKYSKYCQAEIGAAVTADLKILALTLPPVNRGDIITHAPFLDGYEAIDAKTRKRHGDLESDKFFHTFIQHVCDMTGKKRSVPQANAYKITDPIEIEIQEKFDSSLERNLEESELNQPDRIELGVWPSLEQSSPATISIIGNIVRSLSVSNRDTELAFVGVSLKFSINLLTESLKEFAERQSAPSDGGDKQKHVKLTLVHMDEHSHMLQALNDEIDIGTIRGNFHRNWASNLKRWRNYCEKSGLVLDDPVICSIDYIPPRVGILIDKDQFYAGRCYFKRAGNGFVLHVGEREYMHYTSGDTRGLYAITDFRQYLDVYKENKHNGVALVPSAGQWSEQLLSCVCNYPSVAEVTLISQTATKFLPLIVEALSRGLKINLYVQDPKTAPNLAKILIENLGERIKNSLAYKRKFDASTANIKVYYFSHAPTFRAAKIGNVVLGIQMYIHPDSRNTAKIDKTDLLQIQDLPIEQRESIIPGPLRLIATNNADLYRNLVDGIIDHFTGRNDIQDAHFSLEANLE